MQLKELCRATDTTRKAVAYYEEQGLVSPKRLGNGYREFTPADARRIRRITLLRRLGLSLEEIRRVLDGPDPAAALRGCLADREREVRRMEVSRDCLRILLAQGVDSLEAEAEIRRRLERMQPAAERLRAAFPGKYGDFITLHFGRYLDTPVDTADKAAAYTAILDFLDHLEETAMPPELEAQLRDACERMTADTMAQADDELASATADAEGYLKEHEEAIREYLRYRDSAAFRESPANALRRQLLAFQRAVGYAGFLDNLSRLSPAYRAYRQRLAAADESFRRHFPEAAALYDREQAEEATADPNPV